MADNMSMGAAKDGDKIHEAFSNLIKGKRAQKWQDSRAIVLVDAVREDMDELIYSEEPFRHRLNKMAYGGTIDLCYRDKAGDLVLADIKTKNKVPSSVYKEHMIQLCAYGLKVGSIFEEPVFYKILYISREDCDLAVKTVKIDERILTMWTCDLTRWYAENKWEC